MPLPQVNERIKEVPAQALRAVFAGIGQVLLVADKIRNRTVQQISGTAAVAAPPGQAPASEPATEPAAGAGEPAGRAEPPSQAEPAEPAEPAGRAEPAAGSSRWRSLDETGNVRLITDGDRAAAAPASVPAPPASAAPAAPVIEEAPAADEAPAAKVAADEVPAPPQASAAADTDVAEQGGLPLSNYDELTIASLRARLRVLSVAQITTLLEYERAAQARPAVITMFERRLDKLAQDDG